jgi:protein ImuB
VAIPSYDDLTPSIPDVHPRDVFDVVTRLVPSDEPVVDTSGWAPPPEGGPHGTSETGRAFSRGFRLQAEAQTTLLFACVRTRKATPDTLLALARDFSPRIERHGEACIVLDVSGLGRLLGDAHGIAAELGRAAGERGLEVRLAVAPTRTAAMLLSLAEGGVVTGDPAAALVPLPLETLVELAGESEACRESKIFDILKRWGLRAVGEFAALPPGEVASRFGGAGVTLQRLARGIDARPLVPDPGVQRFIETMELEWPIEELEPLSFVFARLLEPLSAALERADRAGAAMALDLRLVDKTTHARRLQLPAPMRDPRVLRTLLLLDLESHPPTAGIDIVRIEIDPAPSRIVQFSLLERAIPSPETLATLNARLGALTGESRCGSPSLLDTYRPDAFAMQRFDPTDRPESRHRSQGWTASRTSRPLVLRRFRPAVAVRVAVEHGRPVHVANLRRDVPAGRVDQAAGPWRTSGHWWNAAGEHWDRDEWDIALADGSVCRLYRDRTTERWFVEGVFD